MGSGSFERVVLITGATDGLGKATALYLAERGYKVFAAGRSPEKRMRLDEVARQKKLPLVTLEMDVCSDESVQAGIARVLADGPIDVLINNAGVGYMAVIEELKLEDLRRQFETNLFGVLRVTQAVLPGMRERRSGRIIMLSSVAGLVSPPTYGAYESSRASPYVKIYSGAWAGANEGRDSSKSTPEDCARVIFEAIESPNPRARYGVTALATLVKWAKRLASDRMVDAFLRRKYRVTREDGPPPTTSV